MPFEIVVETMVQEKIMEALREPYSTSKQSLLLTAIALSLQESMKIQRDILSELEALTERLDNSKETERKE